jgi:hypothetical protein
VPGDIRSMIEETCRETGTLLLKRLREEFDVEGFLK